VIYTYNFPSTVKGPWDSQILELSKSTLVFSGHRNFELYISCILVGKRSFFHSWSWSKERLREERTHW